VLACGTGVRIRRRLASGRVGALLGYAPVAQHDDEVGPADPVEAVAYEQADLARRQGAELVPLVLRSEYR